MASNAILRWTGDRGYHPATLTKALEQVYPEIMKKVKSELSPKPSKQEKTAQGQTGFVPIALL